MHMNKRNWIYNLLLVNRGQPSTYIESAFADNRAEVLKLNKGKVGHPYIYSNIVIISAFALKCVLKIPYRATEGIIKDYAIRNNLSKYPNFRTIEWRIS
ncbi:MAG: transposase, partial [Candidatus Micrarchaeia archaeon]